MGAMRVAEYRERLGAGESLSIGLHPLKVGAGLLFWGFNVIAGVVIAVVGAVEGEVGPTLGGTAWAFFVGAFMWGRYAEPVLGRGPALKIALDGLTIRRWREPLSVPWADVLGPTSRVEPGAMADAMEMRLSPEAFHAYLERCTPLVRWWRMRQGEQGIRLPRAFRLSMADLLALLDDEMIQSLVRAEPPYELEVGWGLPGGSPMRTNAGWVVPLDQLPVSDAMRSALDEWNERTLPLNRVLDSDDGFDEEKFEAMAEAVSSEGTTLARQLQTELGYGARVTY